MVMVVGGEALKGGFNMSDGLMVPWSQRWLLDGWLNQQTYHSIRGGSRILLRWGMLLNIGSQHLHLHLHLRAPAPAWARPGCMLCQSEYKVAWKYCVYLPTLYAQVTPVGLAACNALAAWRRW